LLRGTFENDGLKMFAKACKKGLPVSLIVADIDHFKQVNDRHGHTAGDEAIAGFAALINDAIRSIDIAGRVGGEEFAILVWNCEAEPAVGLAERLRRGLSSRPIRAGASELRLTASFGVAQWQDGESYAQVFNRADAALYQAKNSGRDRVCSGARVSNSQSGAQESPLPLSGKQTPALSAKQTPVSSAKQTPALSAKQTGALSGKQKPVDNVVVLRG
jgi:diguanylate cyclase (GGDEF)-like protein